MVVLNFSDALRDAGVPWPSAGTWDEQIDGLLSVQVAAGRWLPVPVPSHYGAIYLLR